MQRYNRSDGSIETFGDLANLYIGGYLAFSPDTFGLASGVENINAHLSGMAIVALSLAAIYAFVVWEEWLNLIMGLWLMASPFVLHFTGKAMQVHVIIGALVALVAVVELWVMHDPQLDHSDERDQGSDDDVDLHRLSREVQDERRRHEPQAHDQVEPFLPNDESVNRRERERDDRHSAQMGIYVFDARR